MLHPLVIALINFRSAPLYWHCTFEPFFCHPIIYERELTNLSILPFQPCFPVLPRTTSPNRQPRDSNAVTTRDRRHACFTGLRIYHILPTPLHSRIFFQLATTLIQSDFCSGQSLRRLRGSCSSCRRMGEGDVAVGATPVQEGFESYKMG